VEYNKRVGEGTKEIQIVDDDLSAAPVGYSTCTPDRVA
jgi:hypothetical protein